MSADKQALLDKRARIEAEVKALAEHRAELQAELEQARGVVAAERNTLTRAVLARLKMDPTKLTAERARIEVLPEALQELDRQALAAAAPLAGIATELDRLAAAELVAEAQALVTQLRAGIVELGEQYKRLNDIDQELARTAPGSQVRTPVWEQAWRLAGAGQAYELLKWRDAGGQ
jgi:chromosome segregation ATPase